MRLLVDANLSPAVADGLRKAGVDAVHVVDLDLLTASDDAIFDRATEPGCTGVDRPTAVPEGEAIGIASWFPRR
jgi:hypothetical protein